MNSKYDWSKVYQDNSPKLLGMVRRYVGKESVAEDILHDGFMLAIKKEHTFRGQGSFEGWLNKIIINTALQHLRGNKKEVFETVDMVESTLHQENDLPDGGSEFSLSEMLDAIDTLPVHHKTVFNLYVLEKFKHNQIGEMLGISAGTSKSHLARGRKKLQQTLLERTKLKKERDRLGFMWLFIPEGWEENLDQEFQRVFSQFSVTPDKVFNPSSKSAIDSGSLQTFNSALAIKVGSAISIGLISFLVFWFSKPEKTDSSLPTQTDIQTPVSLPAPVTQVHLNIDSLPKKKVLSTHKKQQKAIDSIVVKTVVVKKKIVVKDTVHEYH